MKTVHASEYAVQMKHCCKSFGRVVANDNVDLRLKWGEIHALLGENGSGKTTLVNMLSGIYQPDDGEIWVDGNQAVIDSPKTAYQLGIGMIHQHFMLVDVLSATENIILGQKGGVLLNHRKVSAEICAMIDQYGFHIDPNRKISEMSVSEKQTVEIIKALYRGAEILILDEPTAVLTPQETDRLFDVLRRMKDEGKCVVLISHKINELFAVADKVTILRKGKFIEELDMKAVTPDQLTSDMVGYPAKLSLNCPQSGEVSPIFLCATSRCAAYPARKASKTFLLTPMRERFSALQASPAVAKRSCATRWQASPCRKTASSRRAARKSRE